MPHRQFYRKLYAVEKEARDNQLSSEARHQLGQEKSVPIIAAFKKWLDHHLTKTSEQIEPYKYMCAMLNRIRECVTEDDYRKLLPQFIQI